MNVGRNKRNVNNQLNSVKNESDSVEIDLKSKYKNQELDQVNTHSMYINW